MSLKKEKKTVSLFFHQSQNQRREAFSCESAAEPALSGKDSFYNQDEWLQEIEEHERKSNTSEKQSVKINSLKPFKNSVGRS